jgi:hypothetical protein
MDKQSVPVRSTRPRFGPLRNLVLLISAGAIASMPAFGAHVMAKLDVMISLRAAQVRPETGGCESAGATVTGATSTIVCTSRPVSDILLTGPSGREIIAQSPVSLPTTAQVQVPTGSPQLGAASPGSTRSPFAAQGFRFMSYVAGMAGTIDIYTGAGAVTAFRRVNWAEREYLEMTVTW